MDRLLACLAALVLAAVGASAQPASFKGKTITMIIGYPGGGGTDLAGRLIASVLGRYLPGEPTVVAQNVPGAEGMTALNFFVQQVKPDGLTLTMGSGSQAEPTHYRKPQSQFDPTTFVFIGGVGRSGQATDHQQGGRSEALRQECATRQVRERRSGRSARLCRWRPGTEFLGWNLKWVPGYRGTGDCSWRSSAARST